MEETKYTFCRVCEPNCGLKATVVDGKLTKITGNKEHILSKGYICVRGLATLDIHHDPDRIKYPMKQEHGEFKQVSWESSLQDIGDRIKQIRKTYGNDAVAIYIGNPTAFDYSFTVYSTLAINAMKTKNIYGPDTQDCTNKFFAAEKVFGSSMVHPVPDIDHIDFLIIWGSNPAVSKMSFISLANPEKRLKAIEDRGGRVIIIDPRMTETAQQLGEHLFIRPDTDIFLLMSMLNIIISENLYDSNFVSQHTTGSDELKKMVSAFPAEKSAEVTGLDKTVIESLARDFAKAENAGIHASLGINLGTFGTLGYWLVQCLNAITGRLDKKNSMIFCRPLFNLPKSGKNKKPSYSRIGGFELLDTLPAGILADEILTPGEGQIKALIVLSGNPMLTVPDEDKLKKALSSLDLIVCADLYINETGGVADYVLPSKDFYEHWDFALLNPIFNTTSLLYYTKQIVSAEGERKELWLIFHELMKAAGYSVTGNRVFDKITSFAAAIVKFFTKKEPIAFLSEMMLRIIMLINGISFKKLKESKHGLPYKEHETGNFFKKYIMTDDKKIHLAPVEFINQKDTLEAFFEEEKSQEGFKLIGQRQKRTHNTWMHNVKSFMEKSVTNYVSMNREDAGRLNISDGDKVEVKSKTGCIQIPAKIVDTLMPGVVSIPHGWGHNMKSGLKVARKYPGVNVNILAASGPDNLERFCGMTLLNGIPVDIQKIGKNVN